MSTDERVPKCVVRHTLLINFVKSTMMRSMINSRAFSGQQQNFGNWAEWAKVQMKDHIDKFGGAKTVEDINREADEKY